MFGIALEGGGALGGAHVGVLRALLEHDVAPQMISGTSAGAIVAAAYGWRGRYEDAEQTFAAFAQKGNGMLDVNVRGMVRGAFQLITRRDFTMDGLFRGDVLERMMERLTEGARLRDCALPVVIPAVDLISGRVAAFASRTPQRQGDYLWEGSARLAQAVRASTAIPVVFRPYLYKDLTLVDGGVLENLPARSLRALGARTVLGVTLSAPDEAMRPPNDVITLGLSTIRVIQKRLERFEKCATTYVLPVTLPPGSGLFSFDMLDEYQRIGYETAMRAMPDILRVYENTYVNRTAEVTLPSGFGTYPDIDGDPCGTIML